MVKKKAVPKLQEITRLGKIQSAEFGFILPDRKMIGTKLLLAGEGWGIHVEDPAPCHAIMDKDEVPDWSEEDFQKAAESIVKSIGYVINDCGKNHLSEIVGTPIEVVTKGSTLVSWRVLKEVL